MLCCTYKKVKKFSQEQENKNELGAEIKVGVNVNTRAALGANVDSKEVL